MRFAFIRDHRDEFPVEAAVRRCSASPAAATTPGGTGRRAPRPCAASRLVEQIRRGPPRSPARPTARPRVHRELEARGVACCENTVAKLMRPQRHPLQGPAAVRRPDHRQPPRPPGGRQRPGPRVLPRSARYRLGGRHHLHPDRRGLALPGGGDRPVLAARWSAGRRPTTCGPNCPWSAPQFLVSPLSFSRAGGSSLPWSFYSLSC